MALDATPKSVTANSYVTREAAGEYLASSRLYVASWSNASTADQDRALIWATALLDAYMDWLGDKRTSTQRLRWPRSGVLDLDGYWYDYDTIPELLANVAADFALYLLEGNRLNEPELLGLGFKSARVGPVSVTVDSSQVANVIPHDILVALTPLGVAASGSQQQGDQIRKLHRG